MSTNVQKFPSEFPLPVDPCFPTDSGGIRTGTRPISVRVPAHAVTPETCKVGLSEICLSYRTQSGERLLALDHINLQVRTGEFVCVVGPSGCGKSTFLWIV